MELLDFALGFEVLEGMANGHVGKPHGNGAEGTGVKLGVSLEGH